MAVIVIVIVIVGMMLVVVAWMEKLTRRLVRDRVLVLVLPSDEAEGRTTNPGGEVCAGAAAVVGRIAVADLKMALLLF